MSRIDRSKLNPNFVKKGKQVNDVNVEMFSTHQAGDDIAQANGDTPKVPQVVLKRAATSGIVSLANKGFKSVPSEIFNLDEAIIRDENTKWWEYTDITVVDLSSNQISILPPDIAKLVALKRLDIHDNCISFLPPELSSLQNISKIDISRNRVDVCLSDALGQLRSLTQLNANNNKIPDSAFPHQVPLNLGQLDLSFNLLEQVPATFGQMKKLQDLNLSHNKISRIAVELSLCISLQDLDLSYNSIREIPADLGSLPHLVRLNLNNNRLAVFPKFSSTKKLKELLINSNQIETMPDEYLEPLAESLEILLIADNQLRGLPQNVDTLKQLSSLDVSCNNLSTLPDRLGLLANMKSLKVDGNPMRSIRQDVLRGGPAVVLKYLRNRLPVDQVDANKATIEEKFISDSKVLNYSRKGATEIPAKLLIDAEVKRVQGVNLEANKLASLAVEFAMLKHSVVDLNLASNSFSVFPEPVVHFDNLQSLKMFNNKLADLPATFLNLSKLIELNVSSNCFTIVPSVIYSLKSLQSFSIADNRISEIDPFAFQSMQKLHTLDLQNNELKRVPPELGLCEQIKNLSLVGNPCRRPTFAELNKGTVFVLQKLRDQIVA